MKKSSFSITAFSLFTCVFIFPGCKKIDRIDTKGICRIETQQAYTAEGLQPRYFLYNKNDNPVEVRFDEEGTGRATYTFYYDKQNRLLRYTGYETHSYTYDRQGNAITDTINANYTGQGLWLAENLSYDAKGRIVKTETKLYDALSAEEPGLGETIITYYYNYDNNGNLVKPGIGYDSKVSLYRTNKVWMLVHKNYSLNNPVTGASITYNDFGLPIKSGGITFLNHTTDEVRYKCRGEFQMK